MSPGQYVVWHDLLHCNTDSRQVAREAVDVHLQEQGVGEQGAGSREHEEEGSKQGSGGKEQGAGEYEEEGSI